MAREKKVVLFLVEGPTDEVALVSPMRTLLKGRVATESLAFYCDVTTVCLFPSEASFLVKQDVCETVRGFVLDRIEKNPGYKWKDLERIVHIVDLDGAFIPESCIVEDSSYSKIGYRTDCILTSDREWVIRRNAEKASALRRLARKRTLKYERHDVPYEVYFMSRNLEQALFGLDEGVNQDMKEKLAHAFRRKCLSNPDFFATLLESEDVAIAGDYRETWSYAEEGLHSLERGSNLRFFMESI